MHHTLKKRYELEYLFVVVVDRVKKEIRSRGMGGGGERVTSYKKKKKPTCNSHKSFSHMIGSSATGKNPTETPFMKSYIVPISCYNRLIDRLSNFMFFSFVFDYPAIFTVIYVAP